MDFLMEYAGAIIFGLIVVCLIAITVRAQFKSKGSCGCSGGSCGSSCGSSCASTKNPSDDAQEKK